MSRPGKKQRGIQARKAERLRLKREKRQAKRDAKAAAPRPREETPKQ
jgi:hypothetical protein